MPLAARCKAGRTSPIGTWAAPTRACSPHRSLTRAISSGRAPRTRRIPSSEPMPSIRSRRQRPGDRLDHHGHRHQPHRLGKSVIATDRTLRLNKSRRFRAFPCRRSAKRQEVAQIIQIRDRDRRMEKAHVKVHMGGAAAAIEAYRTRPDAECDLLETTRNAKNSSMISRARRILRRRHQGDRRPAASTTSCSIAN